MTVGNFQKIVILSVVQSGMGKSKADFSNYHPSLRRKKVFYRKIMQNVHFSPNSFIFRVLNRLYCEISRDKINYNVFQILAKNKGFFVKNHPRSPG